MFLLFGFRTKVHPLGWVAMVCQVCGQHGSGLLIKEVTKFTLFFVPLFPVRTKHVLECGNCRSHLKVSSGEARSLTGAGFRPVS